MGGNGLDGRPVIRSLFFVFCEVCRVSPSDDDGV